MIGTYAERIEFLDSIYPEWNKQTLWEKFKSQAERYENSPYIFYQNQMLTYGQVLEMTNQVARSLYSLGIRPGDHVAVSLHNSPVYIYLIFALAKLNAVKIPINMQLTSAEKQYILRHAQTNWLVGIPIPDIIPADYPDLKGVIDLNHWNRFLKKADLTEESCVSQVSEEYRNPDGISDILYTSGSTSFPKGVMLTHDALLRTSYSTARTRLMEEGRRILVPLPFYHIFAYSEGILASMHVGGSIVIANRKFDAENCLYLLKKHHVNDVICVSLVAIHMLEKAKEYRYNFPDLHAAFISPAGPDWLWQEFRDGFQITDLTTGYGMTECGATTAITSPLDPPDYVKKYVGKLKDAGSAALSASHPHLLHVKICDTITGRELPQGESGEIVSKGFTVTPGYYENAAANRAAFDEDGWFHSGDIGRIDSNGMLSFHGRKNDMYKVNGENVAPQHLEAVISQCSFVNQVEVVGIYHEKYGEVGVAFIDAENPTPQVKQLIEQYCRDHLASFQVPKYYVYESHKKWPKTATNKTQKAKLRERALQLFS